MRGMPKIMSVTTIVATRGLMGKVTRVYLRFLGFTLGRPILLALGCAGLLWCRISAIAHWEAICSRRWTRRICAGYLMPAGSSLVDTNQVLLGVEKILDQTPEVESTSRRTGLQWASRP